MAGRFDVEDQSVVEFQLGNKQLLLLFVGLLVICAIFFFIGLRVGEDTARSKAALLVGDEAGGQEVAEQTTVAAAKPADNGAIKLTTESASKPAAQPTTRNVNKNDTPSRRAEKPAVEKKTESTPPKEITAVASGNPTPGFYLQIASPRDEAAAKRLQAALSAKHPTIIQPVTVNGRQHYRVRVGPFVTSDKALEFKRSLAPNYSDAIVAKL